MATGLLRPGYVIENLVEQVVGALSGMASLDRGLGAVLDAATQLVAANEVYVMMREGDQLRMRASRGLYQSLATDATVGLGTGIEGWVAQRGDAVALSDAARDARFHDLPGRTTSPGAMLVLPMRLRGEVVGVFVAAKHEHAGFSDAQRRWLAVLAQMAAVAIENDHLLSRERRRARQAEVLLQLASLDATGIHDYVQRLASAVNDAMAVDKTEVALLSEPGNELVSKGLAGAMATRARKLGLDRIDLASPSLASEVFNARQPLLCKETYGDPRTRMELAELGIRSMLAAPILVDGQPRGVIHLATERPGSFDPEDLSFLTMVAERIGLQLKQHELAEHRAEVERQRAQQEAREGFLGVVSHELKTPVAVIRAYTEVLLRRAERESYDRGAVDVLRRVEEQAVRMLAMIEQLLDLQRIEAGLLPLERSRFDLGELARRVAEEQQLTSPKHTIEAVAAEPVFVLADRRRIEEILHNLVGNAVKYSPHGGAIKIVSSVGAAGTNHDMAVVEVADQGIGIGSRDRERIFERFYQADGTPYKGRVGLGLGLYISKELVTRHGGTMWVESQPGRGSRFFFTLPLVRTADED